jgi:hypothetical protein
MSCKGGVVFIRIVKIFSIAIAALFVSAGSALAQNQTSLPNLFPFTDPTGILETFTTNGNVDLTGPFFQNLGTNGRNCGTCHQPSDAWTVSAAHVKARFDASAGQDPIFRTNDGSICDHGIDVSTLAGRAQAYSLLTSRGLFRISIAVPADAEFDVVGVNNPYGCNDTGTLSMYRRPLPSANLRFLSAVMSDGRESSLQTGTLTITSPAERLSDLAHQAVDATLGHAQAAISPTPAQQQAIVDFEMGLTTAQAVDFDAGNLQSGGATGGPAPLSTQPFFIGINNLDANGAPGTSTIFTLFDSWVASHAIDSSRKASIARGQTLFNTKRITITGVAGLNDATGISSISGTCGTCHDSPNVGDHSVSAALNIGVADVNNPLGVGYLPMITLKKKGTSDTVTTTDPGRALITGQWADIGKVKGLVLRGLAARAPYFHNGSANTLMDVVNFYDQRFAIGFTPQEKADLVAFLSAL